MPRKQAEARRKTRDDKAKDKPKALPKMTEGKARAHVQPVVLLLSCCCFNFALLLLYARTYARTVALLVFYSFTSCATFASLSAIFSRHLSFPLQYICHLRIIYNNCSRGTAARRNFLSSCLFCRGNVFRPGKRAGTPCPESLASGLTARRERVAVHRVRNAPGCVSPWLFLAPSLCILVEVPPC